MHIADIRVSADEVGFYGVYGKLEKSFAVLDNTYKMLTFLFEGMRYHEAAVFVGHHFIFSVIFSVRVRSVAALCRGMDSNGVFHACGKSGVTAHGLYSDAHFSANGYYLRENIVVYKLSFHKCHSKDLFS
jgi:hypothetical protein